MKRIVLLTVIINWLFINALTAQNPFKEFGVDVPVITLSKGKYPEFIPNDTIHRIGTVVIDTRTGKIIELINTDSIEVTYNYRPDVASRWISPDPLAEEYWDWSPYNYCLGNPIKFIDPDGRFVSTHTDANGNVIAVYDDGDLGVYRHNIVVNDEHLDNARALYSIDKLEGGELMGYTLEWNSFTKFSGDGSPAGKIDFASNDLEVEVVKSMFLIRHSAESYVDKLAHYVLNASNREKYDIKTQGIENVPKNLRDEYIYRGTKFGENTYISARDAGNILAGMVAKHCGIGEISAYKGLGAFNAAGNSRLGIPMKYIFNDGPPFYGEDGLSHIMQSRGYNGNFTSPKTYFSLQQILKNMNKK